MLDVISLFWSDFKDMLDTKGILGQIQYLEDSLTYQIFAYDTPVKYTCTIYKGAVPSGLLSSYSQSQNDTDKTDFTTNYQSTANQRISTASVPYFYGPTYVVQAVVTGPSGGGPSGSNKAMVSLLNPGSSGVVLRLRGFTVQAESSSGTNVIVLYELRQITAHSGGTNYTPIPRDSDDAASSAEAKTEPSVTEVSGPVNVQSYIIQSNTAISPAANFLSFGEVGEKAIVLREGEGLVAHQVTSNGGEFRIGLIWTEEPAPA